MVNHFLVISLLAASVAAHALQELLKVAPFHERHDRLAALAGAQKYELDDLVAHCCGRGEKKEIYVDAKPRCGVARMLAHNGRRLRPPVRSSRSVVLSCCEGPTMPLSLLFCLFLLRFDALSLTTPASPRAHGTLAV